MSDRQQGLLRALIDLGGTDIQHHFCCYHLRLNIIRDFSKGVKGAFWPVCSAWNEEQFRKAWEKLKQINPECAAWLEGGLKKRDGDPFIHMWAWCRAFRYVLLIQY